MNDEYESDAQGGGDVYVADPDEGFYDDEMLGDLPGWPKPVGILSIVFGGIGATCVGFGIGMIFLMPAMMTPALEGDPMPPSMQPSMLQMVLTVLSLLINVMLVVGGITCLARKLVTRYIHLAYAVAMIGVVVLSIVMQFQVLDAMDQWVIDYPDNQIAQSHNRTASMISGLAIVSIGFLWPIFCLIWFGLVKKTEDDLTGGALEAAA